MKSFFGRSKASSKSPLLRWNGKENAENSPYPIQSSKFGYVAIPAPRLPFIVSATADGPECGPSPTTSNCPILTCSLRVLRDDVRRTVQLPYGVEANAWIALKLGDLVSELTILCNAIAEFCTENSCPVMRAGPWYEYAWTDPFLFPSPTMLSAPKYMELLLHWVDSELCKENEDESFLPQVKVFCRRLFRVYAHLFTEHSHHIAPILPHLKYSLFHYLLFMKEFDICVSDLEKGPIVSLIESFEIFSIEFFFVFFSVHVLIGFIPIHIRCIWLDMSGLGSYHLLACRKF